jgi:hypothetical protein
MVWLQPAEIPLPLILYAAYSAVGWPSFVKWRAASVLEWVAERGCAACPLSKYCVPLYQILLSSLPAALLLALFGALSALFGAWGAAAAAVTATLILTGLPALYERARAGRLSLRLALLALAHQALGACAMALLWLSSPAVFALTVVADDALQALAAWWLVRRMLRWRLGACGLTRGL